MFTITAQKQTEQLYGSEEYESECQMSWCHITSPSENQQYESEKHPVLDREIYELKDGSGEQISMDLPTNLQICCFCPVIICISQALINFLSPFVEKNINYERISTYTVSPRINVHALIFKDALSFRKHVHALIFKHKQYFEKHTCSYIRTWNDLDNKQMINILTEK